MSSVEQANMADTTTTTTTQHTIIVFVTIKELTGMKGTIEHCRASIERLVPHIVDGVPRNDKPSVLPTCVYYRIDGPKRVLDGGFRERFGASVTTAMRTKFPQCLVMTLIFTQDEVKTNHGIE